VDPLHKGVGGGDLRRCRARPHRGVVADAQHKARAGSVRSHRLALVAQLLLEAGYEAELA
jgi:hypothetical protein